jgi:hypothetical protein
VVRVTLVPVAYLCAASAVHSYRVPGKFIRRLKSLFVLVLAAKQASEARRRLAILPVSKARTNTFYIYRQCTYIVYMTDQISTVCMLGVSSSWSALH